MRVLFLAGYENATYRRKVDLLADAPEVELLLLNSSPRLPAGRRPSADGRRTYEIAHMSRIWGGDDPHRSVYWPPGLAIRRFQPDVIHCEFEQESLGAAQVTLARRWLHPRARLLLYAYQNILRARRRTVRWLGEHTLRAASAIVCASQGAVDVLRQQGYAGLTPVLPAVGIDPALFHPPTGGRTDGPLTIGFAGRLVAEKDVPTLLRAAAGLSQPAHLSIVGDGPQRAELQKLAGALGIVERCEFRGLLDHASMPAWLRTLDVLVLPSRATANWKEQFGRVLVEAMACGVAAVGSDSGAIPEVLSDAGQTFPEGDVAALTQILDMLAHEPDRRRALAARGLARVQQAYTAEHVAGELLKLWQRLAA